MGLARNNEGRPANRLAGCTSPYLLQHAHNPVDWWPWCAEAFAKARAENKLVLVSIGYSSCHWCHVMERECFEDAAIAALMNAHYVCIKVDREERPDVDQVYMAAVQLMSRQGGWPLNCFALPDGRPVYGGTYFPPPQWTKVLQDLHATWQREPQRVKEHAARLERGLAATAVIEPAPDDPPFDRQVLERMVVNWEPHFDRVHGGPDRAPKFPMPNNLEFLLEYGTLARAPNLLQHVELTLDRMALGGIFDQVGGGFARYSTDVLWKVPHFEKMLYDNAQLVSVYSRAYQAFRKPLYRTTVERTLEFIEREMTGPDGAFFSALDADSEGEEGRYYVWTREQLREVLRADSALAEAYYSMNERGHWEDGRYILLRQMDDTAFARQQGMAEDALAGSIASINGRLLEARQRRVRPGLDDKAITSWNALMVKGLCDAHEVFGREEWLAAAVRNMELLLAKCRKPDGGLWHSLKDGTATINGFLEDHCFMIEALLALYGVTFNERWTEEAMAIAEHAIRHFHDPASGLFHFTSDQDPPLVVRPRELHDNVIPASNSSMAKGLFLLGTLYDEPQYLRIARRMLAAVVEGMPAHPTGHSNWGLALLPHLFPFREIAITGPAALALRAGFAAHHLPNRLFLGATAGGTLPLLKDKFLGTSTIFVCIGKTCQLPVATVEEALPQLT